jgi:hypothetical protein
MNSQRGLTTLDYLAEVAKDWAMSRFAAAEDSDFNLAPHRFDLNGPTVRLHQVPPNSREAADPLTFARTWQRPTAWARSDTVVLITDCEDGESVAYQQEIVEIIGVEEDDVVAEAAIVVRIPGLPLPGPLLDRNVRASEARCDLAARRLAPGTGAVVIADRSVRGCGRARSSPPGLPASARRPRRSGSAARRRCGSPMPRPRPARSCETTA